MSLINVKPFNGRKFNFFFKLSGHSIQNEPIPKRLVFLLKDQEIRYNDIRVSEGQKVEPCDVLAYSDSHSVFLVSNCTGTIEEIKRRHYISIKDISLPDNDYNESQTNLSDFNKDKIKDVFIKNGLFQIFRKFDSKTLPNISEKPSSIIISGVYGDPFLSFPEECVQKDVKKIENALKILKKFVGKECRIIVTAQKDILDILEDNSDIYEKALCPPVFPSEMGGAVSFWLKMFGSHIKKGWSLNLQDLISIHDSFYSNMPVLKRIISLSGSNIKKPGQYRVLVGTVIDDFLADKLLSDNYKANINGTIQGWQKGPDTSALSTRDWGLSVVKECTDIKPLEWIYPGLDVDSESNSFLKKLLQNNKSKGYAWLRGEKRPCVQCSACQRVCPVGLVPLMLYKYTKANLIDESLSLGIERCIECGLCSYVCPSKIELSNEIYKGKVTIKKEFEEE